MKFKKKPGIGDVFLPGVGRVKNGQILEGDQFKKFVPDLLSIHEEVEIPSKKESLKVSVPISEIEDAEVNKEKVSIEKSGLKSVFVRSDGKDGKEGREVVVLPTDESKRRKILEREGQKRG